MRHHLIITKEIIGEMITREADLGPLKYMNSRISTAVNIGSVPIISSINLFWLF
jgi:hypothetical protein